MSKLLRSILVAGVVALSAGSAAHADDVTRSQGWELHARPRAGGLAPSALTAGTHQLPGVPWAHVYVPAGLSQEAPAPMALLLHGSGDSGLEMIGNFSDLADRFGVVLLAVDSRDYSWDIMVAGAHLRNTRNIPDWGVDVGRIDTALARAFEIFNVDSSRTALVGFSDGAGYGLSLGANNAGLFHNVIAFAPGLLTRVDGKARGRVFIAHGQQDRVLPVAPTRDIFVPALRGLGFAVTLRLFDGRHTMPPNIRREAFEWWLGPAPQVSPAGTAR